MKPSSEDVFDYGKKLTKKEMIALYKAGKEIRLESADWGKPQTFLSRKITKKELAELKKENPLDKIFKTLKKPSSNRGVRTNDKI